MNPVELIIVSWLLEFIILINKEQCTLALCCLFKLLLVDKHFFTVHVFHNFLGIFKLQYLQLNALLISTVVKFPTFC